MRLIENKYFRTAAVPQHTGALLVSLLIELVLTCRQISASGLENDSQSLVQQAQSELAPLESSAREAAEFDFGKAAQSICEKEVTLASRFMDLIGTSEGVFADWREQLDELERASQQNRRQTGKPKSKLQVGPKSKSKPKSKAKAKPKSKPKAKSRPKQPFHRRNKK